MEAGSWESLQKTSVGTVKVQLHLLQIQAVAYIT